jgi:hypothetical protein
MGEKVKIKFLHEFCINCIIEFVEQNRDIFCCLLPQTMLINYMKEANKITTMNLIKIHNRRIKLGSHDQH